MRKTLIFYRITRNSIFLILVLSLAYNIELYINNRILETKLSEYINTHKYIAEKRKELKLSRSLGYSNE